MTNVGRTSGWQIIEYENYSGGNNGFSMRLSFQLLSLLVRIILATISAYSFTIGPAEIWTCGHRRLQRITRRWLKFWVQTHKMEEDKYFAYPWQNPGYFLQPGVAGCLLTPGINAKRPRIWGGVFSYNFGPPHQILKVLIFCDYFWNNKLSKWLNLQLSWL